MLKWIVLVVIPLLGLSVTAVCIRLDWKQKHPPVSPICDTCKKLQFKSGGRYSCAEFVSFRNPPEICSHYDSKEDGDSSPVMPKDVRFVKMVRCRDCKHYCIKDGHGMICRHPELDYDVGC